MTTLPSNEKLRESFLKEFSAEHRGIMVIPKTADERIQNEIADWWLSKFNEELSEKIAEVEGLKRQEQQYCYAYDANGETITDTEPIPENIIYNKAIIDVLDILRK